MSPFATFGIAFLGSLVPVLAWLWFIEHEDKHPEPLRLTFLAFLGGLLSVIIVIPFEKIVLDAHLGTNLTILGWAAIEEITKFIIAWFFVLRRAENDEPIDSMMYMIVIALGFATLENTLFVFTPLHTGNIINAITIGNFRFLGATILHIIASSTIGACSALAFYKSPAVRRLALFFGVLLAIVLHASFNLSIMYLDDARAALPFYSVWILFVGILLAFEKVKQISQPINNNS